MAIKTFQLPCILGWFLVVAQQVEWFILTALSKVSLYNILNPDPNPGGSPSVYECVSVCEWLLLLTSRWQPHGSLCHHSMNVCGSIIAGSCSRKFWVVSKTRKCFLNAVNLATSQQLITKTWLVWWHIFGPQLIWAVYMKLLWLTWFETIKSSEDKMTLLILHSPFVSEMSKALCHVTCA